MSVESARALIEIGRYERALDELAPGSADPTEPWVHVLRSICLHELGHVDAAIASALDALAVDPTLGRAHYVHATAIETAERPAPEVLAAIRRSVELEPDYEPGWRRLVVALASNGRFSEAEYALRHMRERFPDAVETEVAAALLELWRPSPLDAVARVAAHPIGRVVVVVLALAGGLGFFLLVHAAFWLRRAQVSRRAEHAIRRGLEREPGSIRLQRLLADVLDGQGRHLGALGVRIRLGQIEPDAELIEEVWTTSRRGLLIALAVVAGATAVAAGVVIGQTDLGNIPTWLAAALLIMIAAGWWAATDLVADRFLRALPPAMAERMAAAILLRGRAVLVVLAVAWVAVAPDTLHPGVRTATRWGALVGGALVALDLITRRNLRPRASPPEAS